MSRRWDEAEYTENRTIERQAEAIFRKALPGTMEDRHALLRGPLGDDLCGEFDLQGAIGDVARRLSMALLRDLGKQGRRGLRELIIEIEHDTADETLAEEIRTFLERLPRYQRPLIQVDEALEGTEPADATKVRARIRQAVLYDVPAPQVSPETLDRAAEDTSASFEEYLSACIADTERQPAVDERFVALSLLLDLRENGLAQRTERFSVERGRYDTLGQALEDNPDCELVLVGPPGAGKSTLSARLRFELSKAALKSGSDAPVPFFVHLGGYAQEEDEALPTPDAWLATQWAESMPTVPFEQALFARRFVLLLDALNEMPRSADSTLSQRIETWRDWLAQFHTRTGGRHRVVFTCRARELSASLSSRVRAVRLLEIENLDDGRVSEFLTQHAEERADEIRAQFRSDRKLADLYRTPLSLTLLLDLIRVCGEIPRSAAALFTGHLAYALKREVDRGNTHFTSSRLLSEDDRAQLAQSPYDPKEPYALADDGPLFEALAQLAYAMQKGHITGERAHVVLRMKKARRLYGGLAVARTVAFEDIVKAGADLGVITSQAGRLAFTRQPHQEYLAARAWADAEPNERDYALVRPPWTTEELDLEAVVSGLPEDAPLPEPPTTGWEETVLLGAEMADDNGVIDGLAAVNPALAGLAAARRSDTRKKKDLQTLLFRRTRNPDLDLRERIQAGKALGELGHPELIVKEGALGPYIEPPMVRIPGGTFTMGENGGYAQDGQARSREIGSFFLGRYAVTRKEFGYFVEAGGYENSRWWVGEASQRWFKGQGVGEGERRSMRDQRARFMRNPKLLDGTEFTPLRRKYWREHIERSDDAFARWLDTHIESGKQTEPWGWNDVRYRKDAYPVIGVCMFEAEAYLAWLTAQTGRRYRLPFEAEWERAARGLKPSRRFPWGDELGPRQHTNVYESHIRGLCPIGAFVAGDSAEGCADLSGNIWEWTSSPWTANHEKTERSDQALRVVRGGSWDDPMNGARGACRSRLPLDDRGDTLGFRVCFPSPQSDS